MNSIEKRNINDLIKIAFLENESLELIIDTFGKQNEMRGMSKLSHGDKTEIKELFSSDAFISNCAAHFSSCLTSEEVLLLLTMHMSDVMKKFKHRTKGAWNQLYMDMKQEIERRSGSANQ